MYEEQKQEVQGIEGVSDEIRVATEIKSSILTQGLVNLSITGREIDNIIKISVNTPEGKERISHDIVCIIDISGSMATEAHVKNSDGDKERHGLSYLDILKHAVKTIISCLNEKDRFSLVSYSDDARIEFALEYMTQENKELAIIATDNLQDEGCTNLWSGVQLGLDILREGKLNGQHKSALLLTDGEPNVFPPSGFQLQLQKYKEKYLNKFNFNLNTFAFGKHIDTPLLDQYATTGNGQYCFIPCPGFLGTIFVNAISNILNTMGSQCELELEMLNRNRFSKVVGNLPFTKKGKKVMIDVGDLKFNQPRDIVIQLEDPKQYDIEKGTPLMNVTVRYFDYISKKQKVGQVEGYQLITGRDPLVDAHYCRSLFVDQVREAYETAKKNQRQNAIKVVQELSEYLKDQLKKLEDEEYDLEDDAEKDKANSAFILARLQWAKDFITNLKKDVDGEVTLAVAQQFSFDHWGKHFLPSLCHAHLKQQCNNFCDPGIQKYGGSFFQQLKNEAEQTFLKMPPPKPSKKSYQNNKNKNNKPKKAQQTKKATKAPQQQQKQQQQDPNHFKPQEPVKKEPEPQTEPDNDINMEDYYNAGGGCFHGDCLVQMADGTQKSVKSLKKGDLVQSSQNSHSKIQLVVKITNPKKMMKICKLDTGLIITPKHPIKNNGEWVKPLEISQIQGIECDCVYNFVLENGNSLMINGVQCVSLGHGLQEEKAYHPYFGSQKVVQDLQNMDYNNEGLVQVCMSQFGRTGENQQVNKLNNNNQQQQLLPVE